MSRSVRQHRPTIMSADRHEKQSRSIPRLLPRKMRRPPPIPDVFSHARTVRQRADHTSQKPDDTEVVPPTDPNLRSMISASFPKFRLSEMEGRPPCRPFRTPRNHITDILSVPATLAQKSRTKNSSGFAVQKSLCSDLSVVASSRFKKPPTTSSSYRTHATPTPATDTQLNSAHCPKIHEKINGATIVASLSTMNFGVFAPSLPQVIFSFGTAPE